MARRDPSVFFRDVSGNPPRKSNTFLAAEGRPRRTVAHTHSSTIKSSRRSSAFRCCGKRPTAGRTT
jgi:hypothetical protein